MAGFEVSINGRFWVSTEALTAPAVVISPHERKVTVQVHSSSPSVLFVDDDPETLAAYGRCFEASGFDVIATTDGTEAVRLARQRLPNVIVLDVGMPVVSGYEVMCALQEQPETSRIPIVLFTGLPPDRIRRTSQVVTVVQKPCMPAELLNVIRKFSGRA